MLLCRHFNGTETFRVLFQSVQVPRIKAGRIGKRVRIPHGRATVNDFAKLAKQSQETCQNVFAAKRMPAKRRSGRSGNSAFRKDPVASLPVRGRRGDGILSLKT